MKSDVLFALSLRGSYPNHFAGYDLVGQENVGYPLIDFIEDLLLPSQVNCSLPYFFHAGETSEYFTVSAPKVRFGNFCIVDNSGVNHHCKGLQRHRLIILLGRCVVPKRTQK